MNPLQWMGAIRMKVQTADKSITHISSPPVNILRSVCFSQTCSFLFHKMLIDVLESCGLLQCFSAVWTRILMAPIHCRGSIGEKVHDTFLQIYFDKEANSSTSWTSFLRKFSFWGIPLKQGCPTLLLANGCPAKFCSNSNQTHLSLIFKRSWRLELVALDVFD